MRSNPIILSCTGLASALVLLAGANAQTPAKPVTQEDLLRQIESLTPPPAGTPRRAPALSTPEPTRVEARGTTVPSATRPLFAEQREEKAADRTEKKGKGPTEIVALEATFDQKAHIAVFIGQVVVTDPEFNVRSDKLTAYLKHDDKPPADAPAARAKPAATPLPEPKADDKKAKSGGLDKALAEADPGNICTVTQEKKEADGTITHSIGHGKKVHYDAATGDITLYGNPDMQQGINTCVSTDEGTIMIVNRDGHLRVTGAHKTVIAEKGDLTK